MKNKKLSAARKLVVLMVSFFSLISLADAQSVSMSITNCAVTAPNEIQFDITATNLTAANVLHWNSAVIRLSYNTGILANTADAVVWGYVSGSAFPLSLPPNANPTFTSNPLGATKLQLQTGSGIYNNSPCNATTAIAAGATANIGRFFLKDNTANFVAGQSVGLSWVTSSGLVLYLDCATTVTNYNTAGTRTLNPPCSLTIPSACSSPTVNTNPNDQSSCTTGTATFTGSFTGGSPAPTLLWQVQTGGVGLFADLTETAPYSGTATGTLTITNPNISLSTNRYRLKASNGCPDVFTNDALLTVNPNVSAGTVSGSSGFCTGASSTFTTTGDPGGTWTSTNPAVASVSATGVVTGLSSGSTDITYSINTGCGSPVSSFSNLIVLGNGALAGVTAGPKVCSSAFVLSPVLEPSGTTFSDPSCNTIATIIPSGLSQVSGIINTCVTIDDIVRTYHNFPYVQRHYDIEPTVNPASATATLTLYYTQADFDAYNLVRGINPSLPVSGLDVENYKANILITQYHGQGVLPGDYDGGTVDLINPADNKIVYNNSLNRWEVTFDVNGFSGFFLHTSPTNSPLPVNLISFGGRNNGNNNLLEWSTSSELNSNYFELQRSTDGINYVKINTIAAAGNSNTVKKYSYSDDISLLNNKLFYYRLKQVDIIGQSKYSTVVKIKLNSTGFNVEASPNPFEGQLRVQIEATQKENAQITVNGLSGNRIYRQAASLNKGSNVVLLDKLDNLASGVYLLTVITDTEKTTIKVIKK